MNIFQKLKAVKEKVSIAGAVSKIVLGGKGSKVFDKIDKGNEIFEKAMEIAEMVKGLKKK